MSRLLSAALLLASAAYLLSAVWILGGLLLALPLLCLLLLPAKPDPRAESERRLNAECLARAREMLVRP